MQNVTIDVMFINSTTVQAYYSQVTTFSFNFSRIRDISGNDYNVFMALPRYFMLFLLPSYYHMVSKPI